MPSDDDLPPHRRRLQRYDVPGTARYLTFSCYRRLPLLNHPRIRDRFVERLTSVVAEQQMHIFAWVVMPEHAHVIVLPPDDAVTVEGAITRFSHSLKRPFALEVLNRWRTLDAAILTKLRHGDGHRFWQTGGGYDRNVIGAELIEKIGYVHKNPVRRGLVEAPTDWLWSSARAYEPIANAGPPIAFGLLPRGPLT